MKKQKNSMEEEIVTTKVDGEYDISNKDDWLGLNLRALPEEVKDVLEIKDLDKCSVEQKELFRIVLSEEVKRKFKTYDEWDKK